MHWFFLPLSLWKNFFRDRHDASLLLDRWICLLLPLAGYIKRLGQVRVMTSFCLLEILPLLLNNKRDSPLFGRVSFRLQVKMNDDLNLKFAKCFVTSLCLTIRLVYRCTFVYSPQRGTVGRITDLADVDPDADDIELLEIQYWSGNPVGSGVGFRQESSTLHTSIA
jgi:hypothetical protein